MKKELLRIQDLCTDYTYRNNLRHVYLNLYEGEALGMVGLQGAGKSMLLDCLSGAAEFGGKIFFHEKETTIHEIKRKRLVYRVKEPSSLIENVSVLENLMIIRKRRNRHFFINWKKTRRQAEICLEEFSLEIDLDQKIYELTLVQRHEVEILKAYIMGARLILIDDILTPYSAGDYTYLYQVMCRFQERGVSFLIAGCQLEKLQILTQRCLFLVNGNAVKIIENVHRKQIDEMHILFSENSDMETRVHYQRKKNTAEKEVLLEVQDADMGDGRKVNLRLMTGEIVVVLDIYRHYEEHFKKTVKKQKNLSKRIYIYDFLNKNPTIPCLNLRDNLSFSAYRRISTCGFIHLHKARTIERLFLEQYKENHGGREFQMERHSYMDDLEIYMERIRLQKWDIMFCFNMENMMNCELEPVIKKDIESMVSAKRSVVILHPPLRNSGTLPIIICCLQKEREWLSIPMNSFRSISCYLDIFHLFQNLVHC